jgi:hypothetical protein
VGKYAENEKLVAWMEDVTRVSLISIVARIPDRNRSGSLIFQTLHQFSIPIGNSRTRTPVP